MDKTSGISVVIPTLWRPTFFRQTLESLCGVPQVKEILIISNSAPTIQLDHPKIKVIQQEQNIGVNPAWNLGVSLASYDNLLILNDDLIFDLSFIDKCLANKDKYAILSIDFESKEDSIRSIETRSEGFGCCFFLNKKDYVIIPDDLIIYFGDDWLFYNCVLSGKKVGLIPNIDNNGILSISSKSFANRVIFELQNFSKHLEQLFSHRFKFSIVIPYHHSVVDSKQVNELVDSLKAQTYKNFEVLLIHDGPNPDSEHIKREGITYVETEDRFNDWGHSLRDIGITLSRGQYILFLNCDNVLYGNALEEIKELSESPIEAAFSYGDYVFSSRDIVIFPILLKGQTTDGFHLFRESGSSKDLILTGYPPQKNYIDCMQLVMRRSKWVYYGGWYDKTFAADGEMYPKLVRENLGAIYGSEVLGEHK